MVDTCSICDRVVGVERVLVSTTIYQGSSYDACAGNVYMCEECRNIAKSRDVPTVRAVLVHPNSFQVECHPGESGYFLAKCIRCRTNYTGCYVDVEAWMGHHKCWFETEDKPCQTV